MNFHFGTPSALMGLSWLLGFRPRTVQGAGPRAAACGGDIPTGARRDKSPGDLVGQGIGGAMVYRHSLFVIFYKRDLQ
jgi:hypothetical protein